MKKGAVQDASFPENPINLLAYAFLAKDTEKCMKVLAHIYQYLFRTSPPRSIRRQWREVLSLPVEKVPVREFDLKIIKNKVRHSHYFFIRLETERGAVRDCSIEYSNESLNMDMWYFAPRYPFVKRALQLPTLGE